MRGCYPCHGFIHLHHGRGAADNRPQSRSPFASVLSPLRLTLQLTLGQRPRHSLFDPLQLEGLGDIVKRAFANGDDGGLHGAKRGHDHDW